MKILIFLIVVFNLYTNISKKQRYPRKYTNYEKKKFEEISDTDKKKWPSDIKFIKARITFGGTPKERLYMKRSIEEINKIFRSVKTATIRLSKERDIYYDLVAWDKYPRVTLDSAEKGFLDMLVVPNIKPWRTADPKTLKTVLGDADTGATHGLFGPPAKILIGILTVYSNIITNKELDFYYYSYLDYDRVYTFTHELMHTLGFGNHITSIESVMNTNLSRAYIKSMWYTHGPMEWDIIFIEMKYNKLFQTSEDKKNFLEKLYSNKLRRPDRRSRREKLLNSINN